jgi:hypothetical protein
MDEKMIYDVGMHTGEDTTAGRWRSPEEVQEIYFRMEDLKKQGIKSPFWDDREYSFWVDLHARR